MIYYKTGWFKTEKYVITISKIQEPDNIFDNFIEVGIKNNFGNVTNLEVSLVDFLDYANVSNINNFTDLNWWTLAQNLKWNENKTQLALVSKPEVKVYVGG